LPNPKFNPAAFRPEEEGVPTRNKPPAGRAAKPAESNE
jgi:hypothetical protein